MERELLSLSLFLLAAVAGAARFRSHKVWDEFSLWISTGANYSGTILLVASVFYSGQLAPLVPLSLLILMHATALLYKNHFAQIFGLPLVIGELLLLLLFSEIRSFFSTPVFLLFAFMVHTAFIAGTFRLLLQLPSLTINHGSSWSPYSLALRLNAHTSRLTQSEPST